MVVKTHITQDEEKLYVNRIQDIQPVLDHVHNLHTSDLPSKSKEMALRYVGEIPLVLAEAWAKESGSQIGRHEFLSKLNIVQHRVIGCNLLDFI